MLGRPTSPRWALVAAVVALGGVAGAAHLATGSDHQDTPFVELNPKTVSSRLSKCLDKLEVVMRALLARVESPERGSTPEAARENTTPTSV